ncbi:MAG TPA: hypothetical protein VE404_04050 [Verrucomicrobiae bacterium]|nr:hypothetical protein [Verrucomicrobiae bacterium]
MLNRFPRFRLVLAVSALVLVSLFALAAAPDASAKPCPPPPTLQECYNYCAPSHHGNPLVACTTCPTLVCAYGG